MPLKLIPPREGRSASWRVRGTYLGIYLDRSAGTPEKAVAQRVLGKWKAEIERGQLSGRRELTFAAAASSYLDAGGEARFLGPLTRYFNHSTLARDLDQAAIDACAMALLPAATPATRNRQVYSPLSAILRHNGIVIQLRRPKGAQGRQLTHWHDPDAFEALAKAAGKINAEFGILIILLAYTGGRLSETLSLRCSDVDLQACTAFIGKTKNGEPRCVYLPKPALVAMANHPRGLARQGRVFRFRKSGHLYGMMRKAAEAAGVASGFHILRHTYATWMRRFAGMSVDDLGDLGIWKDPKSARRYAHADVTAMARRADLLPDVTRVSVVVHGKKG